MGLPILYTGTIHSPLHLQGERTGAYREGAATAQWPIWVRLSPWVRRLQAHPPPASWATQLTSKLET